MDLPNCYLCVLCFHGFVSFRHVQSPTKKYLNKRVSTPNLSPFFWYHLPPIFREKKKQNQKKTLKRPPVDWLIQQGGPILADP